MNSNPYSLTWHLMRKDFRQVLSLVLCLFVVAIGFQVISIFQSRSSFELMSLLNHLALIGMPCLFAIGAGALLVGQEKENRTLGWLTAMPIPSRAIFQSKIYVAVICLALSWGLSLCIYLITRGFLSAPIQWTHDSWYLMVLWPLNSLILLLAGMATAWRFQSSLNSLLLILPISLVPSAVGQFMGIFVGDPYFQPLLLGLLGVGCVLLTAYSTVAARRQLSPQTPPSMPRLWARNRPIAAAVPFHWSAPHSAGDSLLHQFVKQNRVLLIAAFNIMIVLPLLGAFAKNLSGQVLATGACFLALTTSWLGVLAFHGDRLHQRIRFLSDRGVSPNLVWFTRHIVPSGLVVLSALAVGTVCAYKVMPSHDALRHFFPPFISVVMLVLLLGIYALSQWVAQLVASPPIAAILAPASVMLIIGYYAYGVTELGAPYWTALVPMVLSFVATFVQMRRWMDLRTQGWFLLNHGFMVVLLVLVPWANLAMDKVLHPGIPPSIRTAMLNSLGSLNVTAHAMGDILQVARKGETDGERIPKSIHEGMDAVEARLLQCIQTSSKVPAQVASEHWKNIRFRAIEWMADPESKEKLESYRQSVQWMLHVALRLRQEKDLVSQSYADLSEICLVQEMSRTNALSMLGEELFERAAKYCADEGFRDRARRRAVAISWQQSSQNPSVLGDYFIRTEPKSDFVHYSAMQRRVRDELVCHLWNLLDAQDPGSIELAAEQVRKDWKDGMHLQTEFREENLHFIMNGLQYPGALWRGEWERQAVELWNTRIQNLRSPVEAKE